MHAPLTTKFCSVNTEYKGLRLSNLLRIILSYGLTCTCRKERVKIHRRNAEIDSRCFEGMPKLASTHATNSQNQLHMGHGRKTDAAKAFKKHQQNISQKCFFRADVCICPCSHDSRVHEHKVQDFSGKYPPTPHHPHPHPHPSHSPTARIYTEQKARYSLK